MDKQTAEEVDPKKFFEDQEGVSDYLLGFSTELKKSLEEITTSMTQKQFNNMWNRFQPNIDRLHQVFHKEYSDLQQFERYFKLILNDTYHSIDDFRFDVKERLMSYSLESKINEDNDIFLINRFIGRSKGTLHAIIKELAGYANGRAVFDFMGGTGIIGAPDVPQFDFENIYESRNIGNLKNIITQNRAVFEFENDVLLQLLNTNDFDALFKSFMLLYQQKFEAKNKEAVRAFMIYQQDKLEDFVLSTHEQLFNYRHTIFNLTTQRFIDFDVLRERGEYEEDFMSRALVFDNNNAFAELFFEDVRSATKKHKIQIDQFQREDGQNDAPYKTLFFHSEDDYFCLIKPDQKQGMISLQSGRKKAYKTIDEFKKACSTFTDALMKKRFSGASESYGMDKEFISSLDYRHYKGEIPGFDIIHPVKTEHVDSNTYDFLEDLGFLNSSDKLLKLMLDTDPEFKGKDYITNPKDNTYSAMHSRYANRVELMGITHVQRWNNEYGPPSHKDVYELDEDKGLGGVRKKLKVMKSKTEKKPDSVGNFTWDKKEKRRDKFLSDFLAKINNRVRKLCMDNIRITALNVDEDFMRDTYSNIINYEKLKYQFKTSTAIIEKAKDLVLKMPDYYLTNQGADVFELEQVKGGDPKKVHIENALKMGVALAKSGIYILGKDMEEEIRLAGNRFTIYANGTYLMAMLDKAEENIKSNEKKQVLYGISLLRYVGDSNACGIGSSELSMKYDQKIRSKIIELDNMIDSAVDANNLASGLNSKARREYTAMIKADLTKQGDVFKEVIMHTAGYINLKLNRGLKMSDFGIGNPMRSESK